ncbi:hypothetical protein V865_001949 [Kwoniella europaea PYCC6329]|uniref:Ubiquitin-like protease family profile domain-containing protein n=1 Tax=Kwoniella europaea PYCC6329 TaxID=1423913 RepID=A0AAX4KEU4_9TREE
MSLPWHKITPAQAEVIESYRKFADGWSEAKDTTRRYHLLNPPQPGKSGVEQLLKDCKSLEGGNVINEGIINGYLDILVAGRPGSVLSLGTRFHHHCLFAKNEEIGRSVSRLEKHPFEFESWLWPILIDETETHWATVLAYPTAKIVFYYDSKNDDSKQARDHCLLVIQLVLNWAERLWKSEKRKGKFPGDQFRMIRIKNGPKQAEDDKWNSGVYACQAMYE